MSPAHPPLYYTACVTDRAQSSEQTQIVNELRHYIYNVVVDFLFSNWNELVIIELYSGRRNATLQAFCFVAAQKVDPVWDLVHVYVYKSIWHYTGAPLVVGFLFASSSSNSSHLIHHFLMVTKSCGMGRRIVLHQECAMYR